MQNDHHPTNVFEPLQRLPMSAPEDLAERIIMSAQGLEQFPVTSVHENAKATRPEPNYSQRLARSLFGARPAWAMTIMVLALASVFVTVDLWRPQARQSPNPFAEMGTQELALVIANLELQEIWLLQDELISL